MCSPRSASATSSSFCSRTRAPARSGWPRAPCSSPPGWHSRSTRCRRPGSTPPLVGVPADWPHHLQGFAAHWDKNTNLANRADQWFLNLFPRESPFVYNRRRLHDAELRPLAGDDDLRAARRRTPPRRRRANATSCARSSSTAPRGVVLGAALHFAGICPLVKRIWTPSWAIFSAGWATLFLALFYWMVDVRGWRRWTLPAPRRRRELHRDVRHRARRRALYGRGAADASAAATPSRLFGAAYEPILVGGASLLIFWLMLYWMYRRKLFIRI